MQWRYISGSRVSAFNTTAPDVTLTPAFKCRGTWLQVHVTVLGGKTATLAYAVGVNSTCNMQEILTVNGATE